MTKSGITLHFIRHGETYFNFYDRVQGWGNTPLTEQGIKDARRSGKGLEDLEFDAVYTSDLARTVETAEIILGENNKTADDIEITQMPEFREIFFGSYEGGFNDDAFMAVADHLGYETKEDLLANVHDAERMEVFKELDPHGHAENFDEFWERLEKGLNKVIENHPDTEEDILIVAHGGTIRLLLEKIVPELKDPEDLKNASLSTVHYEDGEFKLDCYGQVSHFASLD
ncbi:MAG: histidine phosphatase family protein [Atopostipes sp.]|nr:histidine phosphatase family protein [Atopostipes sp.]